MNYRLFGSTSLRVSEIGFGCGRLGGTVEHKDDREVLATLLEAFDKGINFYDTADIYGQGRGEQLLGRALKSKRSAVIIATKAGYGLGTAGSFGARFKPLLRPLVRALPGIRKSVQLARAAQMHQNFSPDYLSKSIDRSLERLQTDYLDVFQLHSPASSIIETGEFVETLERVRAQGKIRWYGVSCRTIEDASLCLCYPGISSVQIAINLLQFEGASSFLALAKQKNLAVIARQPLASGLLAQPVDLLRPEHSPAGENEYAGKTEKARAYQFLHEAGRRTIAQAALQFVLQLPGVSVVIVGMSNRQHLAENLAAYSCPLTKQELEQIYWVPNKYSTKK